MQYSPTAITDSSLTVDADKDTRRALVLVSKMLQNLANRVSFTEKEAYMAVVEGFIDNNTARLCEFLDGLAVLHQLDDQFTHMLHRQIQPRDLGDN